MAVTTERAIVALPAGARQPAPPPDAPPVAAGLVERAAWRLDEVLPPRDRFAPPPTGPGRAQDPALQRGIQVGSVVKTRRFGAPPMLVVAGVRDCHGAVALLDGDAGTVLWGETFDGSCDPLAVLPPADLDGDGRRDVVAYSVSRVRVYALVESGSKPSLRLVMDRSC